MKETITIYHATRDLSNDLKRGYIGGDRKLYCSLHPEGLIGMIKLVPLRDLYPLCVEIGSKEIVKEETGWLILARGRKIYISEENVIPETEWPE